MTRRYARRKRSGVQLTARDLAAVVAVYSARYLSGRQLARLLFGRADSSHARQRLRILFDLGYLRKRMVGQNAPDVYYLGLQGRRYLAEAGICSRKRADKVAGVSGKGAAAPQLMMAHELALGELFVRARLEAAQHGWQLSWRNARMLELERLGVQPDAWLCVSRGANRRQAYLEHTIVMPSAAELAAKLQGYQGLWERTGDPCHVLWLTTSAAHSQRILRAVRAGAYGDCFLVGEIEEAESYLTRPIWRWGAGEDDGMVQWLQAPRRDR